MGANLAPASMRCSFCSADIVEACGLFSICWLMTSGNFFFGFRPTATASPKPARIITGSSQPDLRTISSNVALGEKKMPKIRPMGEIAGCGSATGAGMVAIEDSSTTEMSQITAGNVPHDQPPKYHTSPEPGISGTAASNSLV